MRKKKKDNNKKDILMQNKVFLWIIAATGLILTIPYLSNWPWTSGDYILMGLLIYGTASIFILAARKIPRHRIVIGLILALIFLFVWAELAVGLIGTPFAGN